MDWRPIAMSAGAIVLAALVWELSWYPLEWLGLDASDPLDRICLVFLVLSATETALSQARKNNTDYTE
jgi:hypothetical protein